MEGRRDQSQRYLMTNAELALTVGLLQESTNRLYWITSSRVTATDRSFALGWNSSPTVPSSTVSFNESSSQKPPMIENRVKDNCAKRRERFGRKWEGGYCTQERGEQGTCVCMIRDKRITRGCQGSRCQTPIGLLLSEKFPSFDRLVDPP